MKNKQWPFQLNQEQERAVKLTDGKILVLAGAGSGKTSALVSRIAYLIEFCQVDPKEILGLTFTNKAAKEMAQRVAKYVDKKKAEDITLSTFHSFCFHLLKKEIHRIGFTHEFTIYDEKDIKRLVETLAKHLLEHEKSKLPSIESTLEIIRKLRQIPEGHAHLTPKPDEALAFQLLSELEESFRAYNAVDFDHLIKLTLKLFEEHPSVLLDYQKRFRFIMIDEYQDTNPMQYILASKLAGYHGNLCVVGDDDQSIYGFRGAEIEHILQFQFDHLIKLEQNYRSTPTILKAANHVIAHNTLRHEKTLWSDQQDGPLIDIFHAPNDQQEAEGLIGRLLKLKQKHNLKWSDFAILYRSNHLAKPIEFSLLSTPWFDGNNFRRGIPYQITLGTEFYDRSEIKDLLCYLRVIVNPHDQEALLRIINFPRRGISVTTLDRLTQINRKEKCSLWHLINQEQKMQETALPDNAIRAIRQFVELIDELRHFFEKKPLDLAFDFLLKRIEYHQTIKEETASAKGEKFRLDHILQLKDLLIKFSKDHPESSLDLFIHDLLLNSKNSDFLSGKNETDGVNLLTFHSAKGLEFEACFIVGLEDHILPHEKSLMENGIEEERRLFYVALTRAKKFLTLSMARQRKRLGKDFTSTPSRFLFEIPKETFRASIWNLYN